MTCSGLRIKKFNVSVSVFDASGRSVPSPEFFSFAAHRSSRYRRRLCRAAADKDKIPMAQKKYFYLRCMALALS
jgi:hypothetical protein